ncbi:putative ATP-dependent RNA-helicase [Dunaliella salina]|uniref:RNA helicase n=1 Tax=Dunaliella salina TaxID=3046 RepID=A0ABQ7GSI4_DUNSA|nr:putative ATP-dependent RNA-helicase [Dunaliella salina]|eukprot:KAF5837577.1 putative ATP-dependent RNA-helicase [Dunaliella salina]
MAKPKRCSGEVEEAESDSDAEHEEENEEEKLRGAQDGFVEFEEEEQEEEKALSGRRLKRKKEMQKKMKTGTFDSMGFSVPVLKAIKRNGYRLPTPIQRKAMPHILQGVDVIGMARTGSGKTAAFVIPLIESFPCPACWAAVWILMIVQIRRQASPSSTVLVGGDAMEAQFAELALNPDIIVATPGRLLHHLEEVTGLSLRAVEYAVLDEADRLFEMGFMEQIREILSKMGEGRQTLLFSATLPRSLADFASAGLNAPVLVRLDAERRISPDLRLAFLTARADEKMAALLYLVREVIPSNQLTLVFAATRHHVDYIAALMAREGIPAAYAYGTMDQTARKIHVAKFRAQKVHLLITTDVAARGIDIPLIDNIVNLDFPPKPELFVHRVGRAARQAALVPLLPLHCRVAAPTEPSLLACVQAVLGPIAGPSMCHHITIAAPFVAQCVTIIAPTLLACVQAVAVLGPIIEHVREVDKAASELSGMGRTLSNAYNLYLRTRSAASSESVKVLNEGRRAGGGQVGKGLRGLQGRSLQAKLMTARQVRASSWACSEAMIAKESETTDKSLYIGHTRDPNKPKDETFQMDEAAAELASAVLDMGAEDAEGMNQQRRQYHWDKRKRKYVQVSGDDARAKGSSKKIRTESGKTIDKDKAGKGIYARWVKSQHQRVAPVGTQEAEDAGPGGNASQQSQLSRRFDKGQQHKSWKAKGAAPVKGGELKTKVQVSKDRQKKERRKQWLQERQAQKAGKAKEKGQKPKSGGKAKAAAKGGGGKKPGKK